MKTAVAPAKMKLEEPDSYVFRQMAACGLKWSDFAEGALKDTPDCVRVASKEINTVYPALFRCNEHCRLEDQSWSPWGRCANKVTAHAAAYQDRYGPFCLTDTQSRTRCEKHVANWTRPLIGGILQPAFFNLGYVPADHVVVRLDEVHAMTTAILRPMPVMEWKKHCEVYVRIDDALLLSMYAEVQLRGEPKPDKTFDWKVTLCKGNLQSHPSGTGRVQAYIPPSLPVRLQVYDNHGAVITLDLDRPLDLLATMQNGF